MNKKQTVKIYEKKWFSTEIEAKIFAQKMNGKVYDEDFLGGYVVMYPVNSSDLQIEPK